MRPIATGREAHHHLHEPLVITETMTVNHILRMWPEARAVLGRFKIGCEADGILCLDELCWWRGLDVEAILQALQQAQHTAVEAGKPQELDGQDVTSCPNHGAELRSKER